MKYGKLADRLKYEIINHKTKIRAELKQREDLLLNDEKSNLERRLEILNLEIIFKAKLNIIEFSIGDEQRTKINLREKNLSFRKKHIQDGILFILEYVDKLRKEKDFNEIVDVLLEISTNLVKEISSE